MNKEMFEKVKEQIRQSPGQFNMSDWLVPGYNKGGEPCGTAACIAGFTCIADWKERNPDAWKDQEGITLADIAAATNKSGFEGCEMAAITLLGINHHQAARLFYTSSWPEPFREDYCRAESGCEKNGYRPDHAKRAEVACARIDYFMATGL